MCNVAYVAQAEQMDEKELRAFQRELVKDPAGPPISRGTGDLMRMFGRQGV